MLRVFFAALLAALVGCSSNPLPPATYKETYSPEVGSVSTAELGDTLMRYAVGSTRPSYTLTMQSVDLARNLYAEPTGTVLTPVENDGTYEGYMGTRGGLYCRIIESGDWCAGNQVTGCNPVDCALFPFEIGVDIDVAPATWIDPNQMNLDQKFIYNGRTGDTLKFTYREFTASGYARDAFTQDVQYDLKEGSVIGFKGARLEVLEATNRQITYKVLAYFSP